MFERFTDCARNLMARANREAQKRNHDYVGTEHILLGLARESESVGAQVLKNLNVDFKRLKLEVEKLSPPGPEHNSLEKLPPDEREKRVIQYAIQEARNLKHSYIGSEHLLLGLAKVTDGIAAKVFDTMGIHYKELKEETLNLLANAH
ncbi:MAG: NDP-hexose 4-ketoreductase, partial [Candidatus Brocadiia bacterium]